MSKEAALRAMREANFSEKSRPAKAQTTDLCGHRSMNGRTCTREHGHAAKSHRYS
jgi:hypothetical protein